ncbi:MAG: hypothetical protein P8018_12020 [Acidobacteriota bacterium]
MRLIRLPAAFVALLLLIPALPVFPGDPDGVTLNISRGPGTAELTLTWNGGQPPFTVYRSDTATGLVDPSHFMAQVAERNWIDQPPSGQVLFYAVTSPCVYDPPEVCDGTDNDCDGETDEGCPVPPNDDCTAPTALFDGVLQEGTTVGAADDYVLGCLSGDSRDVVYQFTLAAPASVLVTVTPTTSWEPAVALRSIDSCETSGGADLACSSPRNPSRINVPTLPTGSYAIVVDGAPGTSGNFTIRYDTFAPDTTYGYRVLDSTGTFVPLADAVSVSIPLTEWGVDPGLGPGDEWTRSLSLPFPFKYFGTTYNAVSVNSNHYLTFATDPLAYMNDCPLDDTSPDEMIASFWDDGLSNAGYPSQLLYAVQGTAPNRRFVLEFRDWDLVSCGPVNCYLFQVKASHQVILYENGDIELRYGPRTAAGLSVDCAGATSGGTTDHHLGECATIGIEGTWESHVDADMVQCNTEMWPVSDGRVIYFVHPN